MSFWQPHPHRRREDLRPCVIRRGSRPFEDLEVLARAGKVGGGIVAPDDQASALAAEGLVREQARGGPVSRLAAMKNKLIAQAVVGPRSRGGPARPLSRTSTWGSGVPMDGLWILAWSSFEDALRRRNPCTSSCSSALRRGTPSARSCTWAAAARARRRCQSMRPVHAAVFGIVNSSPCIAIFLGSVALAGKLKDTIVPC
jgi:hypothetical protein